MKIRFVKDWRVYRKDQTVDAVSVGIGRGVAKELVRSGFAVEEADTQYETMAAKPVQTMVKRRGRPPGSKNKKKAVIL